MIFNTCLIVFILLLYIVLHSQHRVKKETSDKIFLTIVFFTFFFFVAFRGFDIGNDTKMYLNLFNKCGIEKWSILKYNTYFEKGYVVFNILLSYISKSSRFFMIIMSAIFNYGFYRFIKKYSKNYLLSTLMYLGLLFFYTSMTMMRQFCAILIVLYALKYAEQKKIIPFILCIIFASLFHSSAWIGIIYYFIDNLKFTKKRVIIILIISMVLSAFIGPAVDKFYSIIGRTNYYESRVGSDSISTILYAFIYFILFFICYIVSHKKHSEELKDEKTNFYLYSILLASCTSILAINMNILSRAILYFSILTIIAVPNILYTYLNKKDNRMIASIILIIFLISYSNVIIYFRPEWNSAYNYKICINDDCR